MQSHPHTPTPDHAVEPSITKSPHDRKAYRVLRLPNQMEVLLVSDAEADRAAVALDVLVGSQSDPADHPGLAQLCEHLIVKGNAKYPRETDYAEVGPLRPI